MPDRHQEVLYFFYSENSDLADDAFSNAHSGGGFARQQTLPGIDKPRRRLRDRVRYRKWIAFLDGQQDAFYLIASAAVIVLQVAALAGATIVVTMPFALGFFVSAIALGLFYGAVRYKRQHQKTNELYALRAQVSGRWREICELQVKLSSKKPEDKDNLSSKDKENLIYQLRCARRELNEAREAAGLEKLPRSETWIEYDEDFYLFLKQIEDQVAEQRNIFSNKTLDSLVARIKDPEPPRTIPQSYRRLDIIDRGWIYARSWFSAFKNTRSILMALTGVIAAVSLGAVTGGIGYIVVGVLGGIIYGIIAQEHLKICEYIFELKQTMLKYNSQLEMILAHLELKEKQITQKITRLKNQLKLIEREKRYITENRPILDKLWTKNDTHHLVHKLYTDPTYRVYDLLRDLQQYLDQTAQKEHKATVTYLRKCYPQIKDSLIKAYTEKTVDDSKSVQNKIIKPGQQLQYYYDKCMREKIPGVESIDLSSPDAYKQLRKKRIAHKISL